MKRDFRVAIVGLAFSLPVLAALFIGSIVLYNCGFSADCSSGFRTLVLHTPIPTLPAATLPGPTPATQATPTAAGTAAPTEPANDVPEPSIPGPVGQAVNLKGDAKAGAALFGTQCVACHGAAGKGGVPNPGSGDETVPPLNPIDPMLKNADAHIFAMNVDLFIQHGSVPEGPSPFRTMPGWGDKGAITQQQIADLIAYIISINK